MRADVSRYARYGGLDLMDVYKPEYMQWGTNRRAGTKIHMKRYCNWLWADGHVERLVQLQDRRGSGTIGGRTPEQWLVLYGVRDTKRALTD